jgi:uncharacterized membrane protein
MSHQFQSTGRPWGSVTALLTACVVTLLGAARGLDPWVILYRATCAACATGLVVALAFAIAGRMSKTP